MPNQESYIVEKYTSPEITADLVKEVSDFYRWIFNNAFEQYLFYPSEKIPISPRDVPEFNCAEGKYVPLEALDEFEPATDFPAKQKTGERARFWHDPKATKEKIGHKLSQDAHLVLLKTKQKKEIKGLIFGHRCTMKEVFQTEEWENPVYYSGLEDQTCYHDFENYLKQVNLVFQENRVKFQNILTDNITGDTMIYAWNALALSPDLRGLGQLLALTKTFFGNLPQEMVNDLLFIGEALLGSNSYILGKSSGGIEVPCVLSQKSQLSKGNRSLLLIMPLKKAVNFFTLSKKGVIRKISETRKK